MYVLRPKSKLENAARILSRGDYECYLMISVNGESKTSLLWWNLPPDQQCTDYLTVTVTEPIET
jgi:hypothetical protein